jgi:DNA processing protein
VHELTAREWPLLLHEIPQPPKQLTYRGTLPPTDLPLITIIGARQYTTYGKQVVDHLVQGLASYHVGIVSGLALGIDSLAHEAALAAGLYTLSIPGSGLNDEVLYPARHKALARRILEAGGALLSEFDPTFRATKWSFIQRNRLMAGISRATIVIEATERSGTLATARMCVDYNRELCVVPGNIFSTNSAGPHLFLKLGAHAITQAEDIATLLGLTQAHETTAPAATNHDLSAPEEVVLAQLTEPRETDELIRMSGLPAPEANALLMEMEIKGYIASEQGVYRAII